MRSLNKCTVKLSLVSPLENWGITAIATTSPRPRLLKAFLKSRLKWRTANRRIRNRKLFFKDTRTRWWLPLLAAPGAWPTATRENRLIVLSYILHVPHLNNIRDADSCSGAPSLTADEATVSALNHRSRVSFIAFLWDRIFSRQGFKSVITGPASTSIAPQGLNLSLFRTASAAVTAVFSMLIPVSEKKLLCVNEGWRTKSCTHTTAPFNFSWSIATPSSDTVKTECSSEGPLTTSAVNWKI